MKEHLIAGIDLGSSAIRLAMGQVGTSGQSREGLHVIGGVEVLAQGISKGTISSLEDAVSALSACLEQAERQIGLPVTEAYVGIGSVAVQVHPVKGVIGVSQRDGEIREEDVHRALESARSMTNAANVEVLHILPRAFMIDGQAGIKDPVGMQGIRLEVDAHIVQGLSTHVRNVTQTVVRTGVDVAELIFAPIAMAEAVTTPRQREVGVAVVNLGSSTTSIVIYEEGELLHAAVIPLGSDHITSDIAIGLRTSLDVAERVKQAHVCAAADQISKPEDIDLKTLGAEYSEWVSSRFVSDIAQARVEELFEKVEQELKKANRSGMLPAGAVVTGGGVKLKGLIEVAKRTLRLPVHIGIAQQATSPLGELIQDPAFSTAIGLVIWGYGNEHQGRGTLARRSGGNGGELLKKIGTPLKKIFKSFIP